MGGHQEGYVRPPDAHVGRPAAYVDQLLIEGQGGVHHIWACDHYKTTLNADQFKRVYKQRTDLVKDAMNARAGGRPRGAGRGDHGGDPPGRAVRGRRRHRADPDRRGLPRGAAGRDLGRDEPHLDERRAPHAAHRALHGPARPGAARLPDRGAAREPPRAGVPRRGRCCCRRQVQGLRLADRGRCLHGRLPPACGRRRARDLRAAARDGHQRLPGAGHGLRGRPDRRHQAALYRRHVRHRGRPGEVHGDRRGAACRRPARRRSARASRS